MPGAAGAEMGLASGKILSKYISGKALKIKNI